MSFFPPYGHPEVRRLREERERVRMEFGAFFEAVLEILFRYDLIGIANPANPDAATEYEPEAGTIVPRIREAQRASDVAAIVDEEFTRWFNLKSPGHASYYTNLQSVGAEIWDAWRTHQSLQPGMS